MTSSILVPQENPRNVTLVSYADSSAYMEYDEKKTQIINNDSFLMVDSYTIIGRKEKFFNLNEGQ
ncbi:MAG: hypothetical protein FWG89_01605 [Treponema sp.]|nr:hypothetical protein [Treponema sp.]